MIISDGYRNQDLEMGFLCKQENKPQELQSWLWEAHRSNGHIFDFLGPVLVDPGLDWTVALEMQPLE